MAEVAFLWHLHQPDYRNPDSGRPVMPWTRLHALRGYRDLALETLEEDVPWMINMVPALLDQLLWYADGGDNPHLVLTRHDDPGPEEVGEICSTFACGHSTMSDIHPAYRRLRRRVESGERLAGHDLFDLQVWSTLAWFGATALRDFPVLRELQAKAIRFDRDDLEAMLAAQTEILRTLPDTFCALAEQGALTTSPYFHPILPLLVNTAHARRNLGDVEDVGFAYPEDALEQLVSARDRMEDVLGVRVDGLWPSEGSVSPEALELAERAGFAWFVSDSAVLAASKREGRGAGPWRVGNLRGFFRDTDLSDRIGFRYAGRDPVAAALDFWEAVEARDEELVVVALDGENPWETFADAGQAFRAALVEGGDLVRFSDVVDREPVGTIQHLHTGSWINADFRIWYGHPDDRRAWTLLAEARAAAEDAEPEAREAAMPHLYAAEGSDWTWWYGEEFSTPFAWAFDALFRAHLRAAWRALGEEPPASLDAPIGRGMEPAHLALPTSAIHPSLDEDSWSLWAGAGMVRWPPGGPMSRGVVHTHGMSFGWNNETLWLRVEIPRRLPDEPPGTVWRVTVADRTVEVAYGRDDRGSAQGIAAVGDKQSVRLRVDIEGLPDEGVPVHVVVHHPGRVDVRYPEHGEVMLPTPSFPVELTWWMV